LLLITVTAFGQNNQFQVLNNEKIMGKDLVKGIDIKGVEYLFPERIHDLFLDKTTGLLTVQLRGLSRNGKWLNNNGNILQYDLKNKRLLWSKKIAYQSSTLQQFSNTMIFTVANKSYCLDINSGENLWKVKNSISFVDPVYNIGIGYRLESSDDYSDELEGIDLKNGNIVWKRFLNRGYGWNDLFYTDDSTIIVAAAGLHTINIKDGKGWDYNTVTGKKDYTGTIAANAVGAAVGLLTGTFVMSTGYNVVRDIVSNALIDSSFIYYASKEQLVKIDKQSGDIVWKFLLPDDLTSKSSILMNDSTIFMINRGFAFMGYRQLSFGEPFIAAFDRETGENFFLSLITATDGPILDFQLLDNDIYLVFKNRILKYSLETGNKTAEKEFPENYGELKYFVGKQLFIHNQDGDFVNLLQSEPTKMFVYTNQGKTLSIDEQLNVANTIEYEDLNIYYLRKKNYKFIANGQKTLIINDEGRAIAEIDVTSNAFMIEDIIYDKQNKNFIAIDLQEIIKDK